MKSFLFYLKRGIPRQEEWLDTRLLTAGELVSTQKTEMVFTAEETTLFKVLPLPIIFRVDETQLEESIYFLCEAFEVRDGNKVHIYGKKL